jgi:hypothetical protein
MAEYKELPRIFTAVRKLIEKGKTVEDVDIPEQYCLNTGHNKFFYNKLQWLSRRYFTIYHELIHRNYNLNHEQYEKILGSACSLPDVWYNNWQPSPEDHYLNMARIVKRSKLRNVVDELTNGK